MHVVKQENCEKTYFKYDPHAQIWFGAFKCSITLQQKTYNISVTGLFWQYCDDLMRKNKIKFCFFVTFRSVSK